MWQRSDVFCDLFIYFFGGKGGVRSDVCVGEGG